MKKLLYLWLVLGTLISCPDNKSKIPVFAWTGGPGDATVEELTMKFEDYKAKGIDELLYNGSHDTVTYARVGALVKKSGMEFLAWIPNMVQGKNAKISEDLYAHNRNDESALEKPAYVPYYMFLCPSKEGSYNFLADLYGSVAAVPQIDGIHLDYIRFPDVILAEGLCEK